MARKKARVPSPSPPPPTPPREESSSEEEEEAEANPATQKAPQNPKSTDAADADSSDGGEDESSDSETDANAFQMREVAPSTGKPAESDEEDGSSSDSPEPIQKKAASKPKAEAGKKRQAAESSPSGGKAKKAKADVEKAAPLSGKVPSELNASSKGKKQRETAGPDRLPSKPAVRRWTAEDEIKILEAFLSHIKANGTHPSAVELIAAVGVNLTRKNCTKTEIYEKVRALKHRHEKTVSTGVLPATDDDLRKFNISEAIWGDSAKEVAAVTTSQNDGASSKSKTGKINKEKADDQSKGGAAKEPATTDTPRKSKKRGNHEELEGDAKADITKETTNTATQNGGTLVRSKSGKPDKEKKNGDAESLEPKEADDTLSKNGESQEEKMDTDPNVKNMRKGFDELQNLYPNLTSYVESIQAQHPCGETLKRAFELITDDKACALEAKIKKQRVAEMKTEIRRADTKKDVTNLIIGLMD
ncbi:unnamed protein product [Alopecurus aequalis]